MCQKGHINMSFFALILPILQQDDVEKYFVKLQDEYLEEREKAKKELIKIGEPAKKKVISGLDHSDHRVLVACVEILTELGDTSQVKKIGEMALKEQDDAILMLFFRYIKNASKEAEDYIVALIDKVSFDLVLEALQKLKDIKSKKAGKKAYDIYKKNTDQKIKNAAFDLVVHLGKDAKEYLVEFLQAEEPDKKAKAIQGLYEEDSDDVVSKIGAMVKTEKEQTVIVNIFNYLKRRVVKTTPYLKDGLGSDNPLIKQKTLEALIDSKSELLIPDAVTRFESEKDEQLRVKFMDYFALFPNKALDVILKCIGDKNVEVKKRATIALGGINDPLINESITKIFNENQDPEIRRAAFMALLKNPSKSEKVIIDAIHDKLPGIRVLAISTAANLRLENSIDGLIKCLDDKDLHIVELSKDALARIGTKAIEKLKKDPTHEAQSKEISLLFHREKAELALCKFITKHGNTGFFEGQLDSLDLTAETLIAIISSTSLRTDQGSSFPVEIKELAISALARFKEDKVIDLLKKLLKSETDDQLKISILTTLFKLGSKDYIEKEIETSEKEVANMLKSGLRSEAAYVLMKIALLFSRTGSLGKALSAYLKVEQIGSFPQQELLFYNIACVYSRMGDAKKSVEYLEKAVKNGFKDKAWIELDKDLDNIRSEEAYKKLLSNAVLFKLE